MPVPPEIIGPTTLAITQSVSLFQGLLPKFTDIKQGNAHDPELATDVHIGEVAASSLTFGIGVIVSGLTGSPVPAFISLLMCIILIVLYERALNYQGPGYAQAT